MHIEFTTMLTEVTKHNKRDNLWIQTGVDLTHCLVHYSSALGVAN